MSDTATTYTVADYLFDRIAETGAGHIFGVPGDFNLGFLDNLLAHDTLTWVGNNNELNAGYAADGYARVNGFGALVTTFGVGELSAINAIAGSYAEYAPVLQIVGVPRVPTQKAGLKVHHTLGDGNFRHFYTMAQPVTCAQAWLTPANAAHEIDRVITAILDHKRPGYIALSPDVAKAPIYRPDRPLADRQQPISSSAAVKAFKQAAAEFLDGKEATVLGDVLVQRLGAWSKFKQLLDDTQLPFSTLAWGKSLVNERSDKFAGIYAGVISTERARDAVENSERLICIGCEFTDNTTAGFTQKIDPAKSLEIQPGQASVGERAFAPISTLDAVTALHEVLTGVGEHTATVTPHPLKPRAARSHEPAGLDEPLTQADLWPTVADWMPENAMIFADQGTSFFGMADLPVPTGAMFLGQPLWGSIGYTLPAALGAGIADRSRRPVVLIGDGSAQLTIQEVSVHLREKTNAIIVLINNNGYTVERAIHGPEQRYNDVPSYQWTSILKAFGGTDETSLSLTATTLGELQDVLAQAAEATDKMVLLEIVTETHDIPEFLADICDALAGRPLKKS